MTSSASQDMPSVRRRLAALLYEGLVLFGVLVSGGFLYFLVTAGHPDLQSPLRLQAYMFVLLGVYFVWFWTHGGQTVAMKAWRVRLVGPGGNPVGKGRAILRYLAGWLWLIPIPALATLAHGRVSLALSAGLALCWMGLYAASALLHRERQFWHDVLCGTRLVRVLDIGSAPAKRRRPGTMRAHDQPL